MMQKPLSIYIHIPFCKRRCSYCDFYSTTALERRERYQAALLREIEAAPLGGYTAATVYFGGGTPSLMGEGLCGILEALRRRLPFAPDCEITLEANPSSTAPELLQSWRKAGFNRISFGLQDCEDGCLKALGRLHTVQQGEAAIAAARAAGFGNISGDIMLATPRQTAEKAARLARYAAGLSLPHISAYLLRIEPDTPFGRDGAAALCPDGDAAAEIYLAVCGELARHGYSHYEVSNFAKAGYESRHNSAYWRLGEYIGFGAAAHSFFGGERFFHPADIEGYIAAENPWGQRVCEGAGGTADEYIMLSLRLREGLSLAECGRRGIDAARLRQKAVPMQGAGLLALDGDRLSLTEKGFLLSNSIIAELSV